MQQQTNVYDFGIKDKPKLRGKNFLTLDQILSMPAPQWLVYDLMPLGGVGVLYGATGSYKSFLALHLAACCATRREAFPEKPCKEAIVFYVAAEAPSGFKLRVNAWIKHHGIRPENLFLMPWPFYINEKGETDALIEKINDINWLSENCLVVIDTLSANFLGNENSSDMANFVHGCLDISKQTNATVLVVHHTGKDEKRGTRGHNSLSANSDFIISMQGGNLAAEVKIEKLKDSPVGLKMGLRAIPVTLDLRAEITSSLVLEEDNGFEDESSDLVVLECAMRNGEEISQTALALKLEAEQGWSRSTAVRAIKNALPDNIAVDMGTCTVARMGTGKNARKIMITAKGT